MKRFLVFIIINGILLLTTFVLYRSYKNSSDELIVDFHDIESNLSSLVDEYADSTASIKKYFSGSEIFTYAKKIDDDSIRYFILTQGDQWKYFFGYHMNLTNQLKTLQLEIEDRDKYLKIILVFICIIIFINTLFWIIRNKLR